MKMWLEFGPVGFAKRWIAYRDWHLAGIIQRNLGTIATPTHAEGKRTSIPELNLTIDPCSQEKILQTLPQLVALKRRQNATFRMVDGDLLEISVAGLNILTETIQDILCVHEIFDLWQYACNFEGSVTVWDVGANIGTASLFFAGLRGWQVVAYEPFPLTAELALRNIERNHLQDKVAFKVAGVGGQTRTLDLKYHHEWRAGNGLYGNIRSGLVGEERTVSVQILDAAQEFQTILSKAGDGRIIAKIDCEGAEYEILRRLTQSGDLKRISMMILETHSVPGEDPQEAVDHLTASGMSIIRHEMLSDGLAMIHAARLAG